MEFGGELRRADGMASGDVAILESPSAEMPTPPSKFAGEPVSHGERAGLSARQTHINVALFGPRKK